MKHALLTATALAALTITPALAADAKSGADFVQKASSANTFEIEASKLALEKSQNSDIKDFAQQMIDDHNKAGDKLKSTVDSASTKAALSEQPDAKQQKVLDQLNSATAGKEFDKEYVKAQTDAHKQAVSLFRNYSKNGEDPALKTFATETLPTLERHQEHVKQLKSAS